jgi:hypothetical protein
MTAGLSDYILQFVADQGGHVFMLPGRSSWLP